MFKSSDTNVPGLAFDLELAQLQQYLQSLLEVVVVSSLLGGYIFKFEVGTHCYLLWHRIVYLSTHNCKSMI